MDENKYTPKPIDLSDVRLPESLMELTEAIAENTHEVWAQNRMNEGWSFGPERNDVQRKHPDLVPYCDLAEGEKDLDRATAMNTIKLIVKLGYKIEKQIISERIPDPEVKEKIMEVELRCWKKYNDLLDKYFPDFAHTVSVARPECLDEYWPEDRPQRIRDEFAQWLGNLWAEIAPARAKPFQEVMKRR